MGCDPACEVGINQCTACLQNLGKLNNNKKKNPLQPGQSKRKRTITNKQSERTLAFWSGERDSDKQQWHRANNSLIKQQQQQQQHTFFTQTTKRKLVERSCFTSFKHIYIEEQLDE
jgi:hypothetical protein